MGVNCLEEVNLYLGFHQSLADDKYENYIILQKAFEFNEQDIQQGLDGEYLEVNGQENSGHKCCNKASISKEKFTLEIDSKADEINGVEVFIGEVRISSKFMQYIKEILGEKLEILD